VEYISAEQRPFPPSQSLSRLPQPLFLMTTSTSSHRNPLHAKSIYLSRVQKMTALRTFIITLTYLFTLFSPAITAATPSPIDIGIGVPCGKVICAQGLVCCNASCGTCTVPGGKCLAVICPQTDKIKVKRQEDTDVVDPRVRCGLKECLPGQRCCNAKCGYCVYPREVCVPEICPRDGLQ